MRTIRTKIYKFSELENKAKQTAIQNFRESNDLHYIYSEANNSREKFCEIFPVTLERSNYGHAYRFSIEDNVMNLRGQRLATYIYNNYYSQISEGKYYGRLVDTFKDGTKIPVSKEHPAGLRHVKRHSKITRVTDNCPLTGMCYDCDLINPITDFINKPTDKIDFEDLLNNCLHSLDKTVESEIEFRNEDEQIIEDIEANEREFYANGKEHY